MPTLLSRVRRIERALNLPISRQPTSALVRRLRRVRVRAGLSLREMAGRVGCSHVFLFDIERGARPMSPEFELRLEAVLAQVEKENKS